MTSGTFSPQHISHPYLGGWISLHFCFLMFHLNLTNYKHDSYSQESPFMEQLSPISGHSGGHSSSSRVDLLRNNHVFVLLLILLTCYRCVETFIQGDTPELMLSSVILVFINTINTIDTINTRNTLNTFVIKTQETQ